MAQATCTHPIPIIPSNQSVVEPFTHLLIPVLDFTFVYIVLSVLPTNNSVLGLRLNQHLYCLCCCCCLLNQLKRTVYLLTANIWGCENCADWPWIRASAAERERRVGVGSARYGAQFATGRVVSRRLALFQWACPSKCLIYWTGQLAGCSTPSIFCFLLD